MRKPWDTVKIKILLGYFFLAGIAAFTVWLIYSEVLLFTDNESRMTRLNNKILFFNTVLTNLYQAEALERSYSQTGSIVHYNNYDRLMNIIYLQLDTLAQFSDNPKEKVHTDSILILLDKKRKNLGELTLIKKATSEDLYERAMDKFNINKDSINALLNIRTIITDKSESTYVEQKKRNFFERLRYAFNPEESPDSMVQVNRQQIIHTDTIINEINTADSVIQFLTSIMEDIRKENETSELQLARKQREVLANDRTITIQLRQILAIFEKDIFVNSLLELNALQNKIRETTWYLIALGGLALIIIIFFLVLILKDITRSQHYRNKLEHAKAYSDSLLKSKEQIMLSLTHDIKSPLASVMGYARLMNETESNERKAVYLDNINKSGDHILKLVSDLVDLTRLETGKLNFEYSGFNLYELIRETCSGFYPLAVSKKLDFRLIYNIPHENDYTTDAVRLKQVLGNMLSNAIKYTMEGSVIITVGNERLSDQIDIVTFEFRDTGIGISEENFRVIFNEFTRISDNFDGAGLGLSIAHRIVTLLKGDIDVQSIPGEGSCFTVRLPLERFLTDKPEIRHHPVHRMDSDDTRVLVIDDDVVFLGMTCEIIEKAGMIVRPSNSALNAVQILDEFSPDLIITDLQMPAMNGMDLLTYIQRKTGRMVPVILLTGTDSPDTGGIVFSAVLKKPFQPEELLNSIERLKPQSTGERQYSHSDTEIPEDLVYKSAQFFESDVYSYSLDQIRQFALDDKESMKRILISFAESSYENLILFDKYITEKNRRDLSELAHKMMAMFRQLEATYIVEHLIKIEQDYYNMSDEQWSRLSRETLTRVGEFINVFCDEQRITL
jgi:signal transduction histidine kinase/CheY-like chemotaxis protein